MHVVSFTKNFELRFEGYSYRPFRAIVRNEFGKAAYDSKPALQYIASTTLVVHTPLGPLSMAANYYDRKDERWSFIFNFGYILFNRSPRD
jgi:NTE family protein